MCYFTLFTPPGYTPWKLNIAPEKSWLEVYFPIGKVTFQGRTVKLREGNILQLVILGPTLYDVRKLSDAW